MIDLERFILWFKTYNPLDTETVENSIKHPKYIRGRPYTEINVFRYLITLRHLVSGFEIKENLVLLDIGAYPGGWASLIKYYFSNKLKIDLLGLGFSKEFITRFKESDNRIIEFDIDINNPVSNNLNQEIPLYENYYDIVSMLETIEHLYNPLPILKKIHKSVKKDGRLIITTDNPFWFGFIYQVLFKKRNPFGLVQDSHIFKTNNWRPHFRLYDINDLKYLLEKTGFKVTKSIYFNDNIGRYYIKRNKLKYKYGFKSSILKLLSFVLPQRLWANRILIVAKPLLF